MACLKLTYRVSHNTGLTFSFDFLSVYIHPKCSSWRRFEKFRIFAKPSKLLHFRLVYKVGPVLWNTLYVYFRPFLVIDIVHSIVKGKSMIPNLLAAAVLCDRVPYCDDPATSMGQRLVSPGPRLVIRSNCIALVTRCVC